MIKRYLQYLDTVFLDPQDEATGLQAITADLPKRAARRMSRMGMMLHHLLRYQRLDLGTTVVYGTCFSESSALEKYLDSFPHASPTAFQTSIHPGGIEQALILDQREVGAFLPMAGSRRIFLQMLKVALTAPSDEVVICGGEEKGGWLRDYDLAYTSSLAFVMRLVREADGALGEVTWSPGNWTGEAFIPGLEQATRDLAQGRNLQLGSPADGDLKVTFK